MTDFAKIIKKLRKEQGKTQDEIAKDMRVSKSTIAMWETGKRLPSPELYEQIADYFNVDIDYLYGRSEIRQKIHYDPDGHELYSLRPDESGLLEIYNSLNKSGMRVAHQRLEELAEIPRYTDKAAEESSISGTG